MVKAGILEKINKDIKIEDVEYPVPGYGEVVIRQRMTGICYRDILTRDGFFGRVQLPIIPGHEVSGIIEEVGDGVENFKIGDRVSSLIYIPCGVCKNCISGNENLCRFKKTLGENLNGAYSEIVKLNAKTLVKVPANVSEELSTVAACVTGMIIQAIQVRGRIKPGQKLLITGAGGGVGSHAIQIGKALGAEVIAASSSPEKFEKLHKLGADHVIDSREQFSKKVKEIFSDGVDVVLEATGKSTFQEAFKSLDFGGRMIIVGNLNPDAPQVPIGTMILKGVEIAGSISSTRRDVSEALYLSSRGMIHEVVDSEIKLEDVNSAFDKMKNKRNTGKIFIKF